MGESFLCCWAWSGGFGRQVPLGGGQCALFWDCGSVRLASTGGVGLAATGPQVRVPSDPSASGVSARPLLLLLVLLLLLQQPGWRGQVLSTLGHEHSASTATAGAQLRVGGIGCMQASPAAAAAGAGLGAAGLVVHHWGRGPG